MDYFCLFFYKSFRCSFLSEIDSNQMFDQEVLLDYLTSPEGINQIIIGIILVGAINAIFITYSVRSTYGAAKKEKQKLIIQQAKIHKLSPK